VTGFVDQSDNLQQCAAPTTANQTTPTPPRTPTTASLTVIKIVSGTTNVTSSDFAIHVSGINTSPANFNGSSTGTDLTLNPGAFNVTETGPTSSFNSTATGECSGTIEASQRLTSTITNVPKTFEECFKSLLTTAQLTTLSSY
jgi:hypothetical protein